MCTNYEPPSRDRFIADLDWPMPTFDYRNEAYPGYLAPIRLIAHESGEAEVRRTSPVRHNSVRATPQPLVMLPATPD